MNHGSLFSGIGGFDYAAELMGWNNIFHCEWNDFGKKILSYYWPKAISYDDITKTDFTIHRGQIDVLTGGFPCQPYSAAGKRKGKEDDRHLWPEMLRAIREIQPVYIVGENVYGLVNWNGGMVFDEVQADLEAEGYEVAPVILPACAVGAPHRRDRVWFVAYADKWRWREGYKCKHNNQGEWKICENEQNNRNKIWSITWNGGLHRTTTNTNSNGLDRCDCKNEVQSSETREYALDDLKQTSTRYRTETFDNFPTQSPICSRDDGLSARLDGITFPKWRNESIKAYGNAIVPQVAFQILKSLQ